MILEAIADSLKESHPTLDIQMLGYGTVPYPENDPQRNVIEECSICINWPSRHHRPIVHLATISLIKTTISFIVNDHVPPTFHHHTGKHRYDINDPNSILIIERIIAGLVKNATRIEKALDGLENVSSP